jgi:anaerobic magnesium-protoporphyrin IX monomethyl ester cyclase
VDDQNEGELWMRIGLINISSDIRAIGLLNVSSFIKRKNIEHPFVYFLLPSGIQAVPERMVFGLSAFLREKRFDLIGISVGTVYYNVACQVTQIIRENLPDAFVVWGGIHATAAPDECLQNCDAVCIGEGEEPFLEFVQRFESKKIDDIKNIYVNTESGIKKNELRELVEDLDSRPFPEIDWENTYYAFPGQDKVLPLSKDIFKKYSPKQGSMYDIMASRGCPLSCTYCCNSIFQKLYRGKGKLLRFRSVDHVIEELKHVICNYPSVKIFDFQDDAFGSAPESYLKEFSEKYLAHINKPFHIRFIPTMVNENKIALLKKAGLVSAVIGLQSSDRVNRIIYRRPTTRESFLSAAKLLHKYNIAGRYDVIIDNPYEEENDLLEVIRTLEEVPKPYKLNIFSLLFLPFTELTLKAISDGFYLPVSSVYFDSWNARKNHIYPFLAKVLEMTPYNPKMVIDKLLVIKNEKMRNIVLNLYYNIVFKPEKFAIKQIMKNSNTMLIAKKFVYSLVNMTQKLKRKENSQFTSK